MKHWLSLCGLLLIAIVLCSCERGTQNTREAFIGEYSFVSTGLIALYLPDSTKAFSIPVNENGELSIVAGTKENEVLIIAKEDTTYALISGYDMYMQPDTVEEIRGGVEMKIYSSYSRATLENNRMAWMSYADVSASFKSYSLFGKGEVEIVATKLLK
jgi:hypothetical protein